MSDSGNTRGTARDIFFFQGKAVLRETIGLSDRRDFFRVKLNQSSNFTVHLKNLRADVNVALLGKGQVRQNPKAGRENEKIDVRLEPGTYFIRVSSPSPFGNTSYRLVLTDKREQSPPSGNNNAAPTDILLSNSSISENVPVNTVVGSLSSVDSNTGDTYVYSFVNGNGGEDNSLFRINGNQLLLTESPNFEVKDSYSILLQTTDQGNLSLSQPKQFTVSIKNIVPPLPEAELKIWENNIRRGDDSNLSFAQQVYERIKNINPSLDAVNRFDAIAIRGGYYDAGSVFSQIAEHTTNVADDSYWYGASDLANSIYIDFIRESFKIGDVQGFNNFSNGLEAQYLRAKATGNTLAENRARDAIALLATGAAYTRFKTGDEPSNTDPSEVPPAPTSSWVLSREVAYGINTLLSAKQIGLFEKSDDYFKGLYGELGVLDDPNRGIVTRSDQNIGMQMSNRLVKLVDFAFGHFDQWFITENTNDNSLYVKPFMVGLTAKSLIRYVESTSDTLDDLRLKGVLQSGLEEMWNEAWIPEGKVFKYIDRIPSSLVRLDGYGKTIDPSKMPSEFTYLLNPNEGKDLNLVIAPAYEWVYSRTGDERFLEQADEIFKGGVERSFIGANKQFSENYFWSFDYVEGRQAQP